MLSCLSAYIKLYGTAFLISIHSEIQLDFTFNFDHSWMLVVHYPICLEEVKVYWE